MLIAIPTLTHHGGRSFSPALVYLVLGIVAALAIGLIDAPWLTAAGDAEVVERISEITVVIALFATGLRIDHDIGLREWRSPMLLLGVVMPLTIAAVATFGVWAMGLSLGAAIVLAAALAPTDPVLAGDLGVRAPGEGDRSEPAFALTSEAGLNDGLAFPFVYLGLVVASGGGAVSLAEWFATDVLYAIVVGVAVGAGVGWLIAFGAVRLRDRGLLSAGLDGWAAVGAVLAIYGLTELAGGYGFLAAFAGGMAFRRYERDHEYNDGVHAGAEALERALELTMILFLGSLLTMDGLRIAGWESVVLAAGLILLVRPAATLMAMTGSRTRMPQRLYIGFFGIRGVGSIYYATAAVGSGILTVGEGRVLVWTVAVVVCISIVVHGMTASGLTRRLAPDDEPAPDAAGTVRDEAVI